jgi:hypothetical protein
MKFVKLTCKVRLDSLIAVLRHKLFMNKKMLINYFNISKAFLIDTTSISISSKVL